MALGKTRFAIQDFSRVLELKPDFTAARLQRGTVFMKTGEYHEAATDFATVVRTIILVYTCVFCIILLIQFGGIKIGLQ